MRWSDCKSQGTVEGTCETVVSNYDRAVSRRLGAAIHKTPQNQASDNPQLLGRAKSLYEELLAKTLRNMMDVVGAVRGEVVTFLQMQLLARCSLSSGRPCGAHRHAALSRQTQRAF